ncbi:hypothetical protein BH10PSE2_BH10PSE2_19720 [soil metagenome]
MMRQLPALFQRHRGLAGKFLFEIVIVFVGVTAAFAVDSYRQDAEDAAYRHSMVAALVPTLEDLIRHNAEFDSEVSGKLAAFNAALSHGEHPALPIFREQNSERPPTRAWDGIVSTGAAKTLKPALFFDLALFYTRQESFGERYVRYNDFTETRVYALGPDPAALYASDGRLKPEFAAHVDRLRDLKIANDNLTRQAVVLRDELAKVR